VARALPSSHVVDVVQARSRRSQDDRGFRPAGAEPGAASAAADPDRRRHPRGRAGRVERMEADAAEDLVRSRGGAAPARPQAAWPDRNRSPPAGGAGAGARLEGERRESAREAVVRQLLARRAASMADRQCEAGCGGRSAYRGCDPQCRCGRRSGERRDARERVHSGPRRALLPYLRGACLGGREHHRRSDPHHEGRHGARQSPGARRARPALSRPAAAKSPGARRRIRAHERRGAAAAVSRAAAPHQRLRGGPVRRDRRASVDPNHRRRGECPRPAGAACGAGCGDPPLRAHDPLRAHRHLWRAGGGRLLSHRARRLETDKLRGQLLDAAREPSRAKAA
jgi:hypothetical protein